MARTPVTLEDKFEKIASGDLSNSEQAFLDWVIAKAEENEIDLEIDPVSFKAARALYNDYNADPDVAAANEERKLANAQKKAAAREKAIERAKALLAEAGILEVSE